MFRDRMDILVKKYGSLRKIAIHAKVPYNTLYDYYTKNEPVKTDLIIRISEYTGCSLDWLLTDKGEMYVIPSNCPADPVCQEICELCMSLDDPKERKRLLLVVRGFIDGLNNTDFKHVKANGE